jgi:hypothetical protein
LTFGARSVETVSGSGIAHRPIFLIFQSPLARRAGGRAGLSAFRPCLFLFPKPTPKPMNNNKTDAAERNGDNGDIYVKFPINLRDRLHEFSGAQLKVWLAYLTHANQDFGGLAWPGLELLTKETGLSDDYISQVRWELVKKGWLVSKGIVRKKDGTFSGAPAFQPVIPELSDAGISPVPEKVRPRKKSGTGKSQRTDTGKFTAADTGKSPVGSRTNEVELKEEEPTNLPTPLVAIRVRAGVVGWMVRRFSDVIFKPMFYTDDEADGVEELVEKYGEQNIKDAFEVFLQRSGGFNGAVRPLSLFFKNLHGCSEGIRALREIGLEPNGTFDPSSP